jgi:branched-chain amino acid transport system substrate-binding protein
VHVGLLLTLSGVYESIGTDARDGFQLFLATHGNRLGGHPVNLSVQDEGATPETAAAATQILLDNHVQAIAGPVNGVSFEGVVPLTSKAKVPIVGVAARPDIQGGIGYVWNVSFMSGDAGAAIAPYIHDHVKGTVYAIGADYQGGWEQIRGFTSTFTALGGKLANSGGNPTFTPFPTTTDFRPYLEMIKASGAKAVYCYFAGQEAIDFVKQYATSDVSTIPLYASGVVTEGSALKSEGPAAAGITSVLDYSPDVDTAANRGFVSAWSAAHDGDQPTVFSMTGYDAAAVLDQAIAKAGPNPSSDAINTAMSTLGRIGSPRGAWQMAPANHAPVQKWYLRRVQTDGTALANVKIEELATIGG